MAQVTDPEQDVVSQVKCSLAAEVARKHGKLRLRVTGLSMLPAVWPGDIVTVQSREAARLLPGELVLVDDEGRLRLHRLIASQMSPGDDRLVTRGDSLAANDPPVRGEQVLGVVTSIERGSVSFAPSRRLSKLAWLFSDTSCLSAWTIRAALRLRFLSRRKETLRIVS